MDELMQKFQSMGVHVRLTRHLSMIAERRLFNGQIARFATYGSFDGPVSLDVREKSGSEFFELQYREDANLEVLDLDRGDRHLLLGVRVPGRSGASDSESAFLCGHDERAWFVAAIPESAAARTVQDAKDALKPPEVWEAIREHGVPMEHRDRRKTAAFVRQGEWFFIPRPGLRVNQRDVLRDEPIRRGAGKPHQCQFLYRTSGEMVWVHWKYPNGLTQREFDGLPKADRRWPDWRQMARDANVYVRGTVRHTDHKTVWLKEWHEVVMNTESRARAMAHVAFLD